MVLLLVFVGSTSEHNPNRYLILAQIRLCVCWFQRMSLAYAQFLYQVALFFSESCVFELQQDANIYLNFCSVSCSVRENKFSFFLRVARTATSLLISTRKLHVFSLNKPHPCPSYPQRDVFTPVFSSLNSL